MSKEKIIEQAEKLIKAGKFDKAIKEYQKLVAEDPSDMRARLKIADLHAKKKDIPNAVKLYREVAEIYDREDFHLKSIAVYKTILKHVPTMIEINERLGNLYQRVGLTQDAINQYHIVSSYYDSKAMAKEAAAIRKKIVDLDPDNATGRVRLAELLQSQKKTEEALQEYERAAEILRSAGQTEGLPEIYERMIYLRPHHLEILLSLCRLYLQRKEYKRLLKRIDASSADAKKLPSILEVWAEALLGDRQAEAARRKFKEWYAAALADDGRSGESAARARDRMQQEFGEDDDMMAELLEMDQRTRSVQG